LSLNVTWGQRKRFADGKVSLPYKRFLGYEKGEDGLPQIVEAEAKIVRLIYKMFLEGKTPSGIASRLTKRGIPTPSGKQTWQPSTVKSILTNEKYKGEAILQKRFTVDFLTKKMKVNEGEVPQYYVENSHPPIISPETFELVQEEFRRREAGGHYTSGISCFASRIVCGDCGSFYGRKVWHSTSKYRRTIWQCNHKFKNKEKCQTPHLDEDLLKRAFIDAFNSLIENKDEIIKGYEEIIRTITDTSALDKETEKLQSESEVLRGLIKKSVDENASLALDQKEYQRRYSDLVNRFEEVQNRLDEISCQIVIRLAKRENIENFIKTLQCNDDLLTDFDEELWYATVKSLTVHNEREFIFTFKNGKKLQWQVTFNQ